MTVSAAVWEVVGGARSGGIVVRNQKERSSPESSVRLLVGALVRAVEHDVSTGRLRYELLSGSGPRSGWVTTSSQGKELLRPWAGPLAADAASRGDVAVAEKEGLEYGANAANQLSRPLAALGTGALKGVSYAKWQGKGKVGMLNCKVVPNKVAREVPGREVPFGEETMLLCPECSLPIGDFAYRSEGESGALLHGECEARLVLQLANKEERLRKRKDAELKKARRAEYDIGWKVERIPSNLGFAQKMGAAPVPFGMYALTFEEESNTAFLSPTLEPSAVVNLEYLALALQVRMREGREPLFSLDPKTATHHAESAWQVKHIEPAWLAGTSVGEAMFQADVHLKELSMGEYTQPVIGMKSCFDLSEEAGQNLNWNAREWFVVRRAEVNLSEENALIPRVNMGVEAREQVVGENGLEDALLTSRDHPLVKYAEAFEHNFDLIAERKSVVHHLRELAKASVLAKFLVDNEVLLEDSWFNFEVEASEKCVTEIPQLWNERYHSEIQVRDGKILDAEGGARKHGLYGGVEIAAREMVPGVARVRVPQLTIAQGTLTRAPTASGLLASGQEGFSYGAVAPRGVDLNLSTFDLSDAKRVAPSSNSAFALGSAFFHSLDSSAGDFSKEEATLLRRVFNPMLSDRRSEGDIFMPPDAGAEFIERLRGLVAEEKEACEKRKEHFLSPGFCRDEPGPLFPSSWVLAHGMQATASTRQLYVRPDYKTRMERTLKSATPVFDKVAEDGSKFRIYEVGSLEVRTVQEHGAKEEVGVVLSTRALSAAGEQKEAEDSEAIVRVTQFVEGAKGMPGNFLFYVVLETRAGNSIVTERTGEQSVVWAQNPEDLDARNSFAKTIRTVDCAKAGLTVADVKKFREEWLQRSCAWPNSPAEGARYAEEACGLALPAREKSWALLSQTERNAVEQLGMQGVWGRERPPQSASNLAWEGLTESQRELAGVLGFDDIAWGKAVSK